jgi:hypothetical protein
MTAEAKQTEKFLLHRKKVAALAAILICVLLEGSLVGWPILGWSLAIIYFGGALFVMIIVAYLKIRQLGYFPTSATTLLLGVGIVSGLALLGTTALLPQTSSDWDSDWEVLAEPLIYGVPAALMMVFGCTVLVRKLPKRNPRVFGPRRSRFPFVWFGYLLIVVPTAVLLALLIYLLVSGQVYWSIISFCLGLLVIWAFRRMASDIFYTGERLRNQTTIEDVTKFDARLPVVFLRPFATEQMFFVKGYGFDEYLRSAFWELIGPFVALGNPQDYLPRAFRTYVDDEGWYEYFERLAGQAACIVMPVSNSDNLQRELTFIRRQGLQQRLFILTDLIEAGGFYSWPFKPVFWIMLQLYGPPRLDERPTWKQLVENLGKLGFEFGDDPGRGAVVTFDSEGEAKILVKGAKTPQEFVEPIRDYLGRPKQCNF